MSIYLDKYISFVTDNQDLTPIGFAALAFTQKRRIEIVNGLLVAVVDAMNEAGDQRAVTWSKYLAGIEGPIANGSDIEGYARHPDTIKLLSGIREKFKGSPPAPPR